MTSSSACRSVLKNNNAGGNLICVSSCVVLLSSKSTTVSSACLCLLYSGGKCPRSTGGNLIDAEQRNAASVVSRVQSTQLDNDRSLSSMTSAARDSPSASSGLLSVTTTTVARQASDAGTQTPPSLKNIRRSLIDYSNLLYP